MSACRVVLVACVAALCFCACGSDPEGKSGADAQRGGALPMEVDEPVVDSMSASDGDTTDWRSVELPVDGAFTVTFTADVADATAEVGIYDKFGKVLATGTRSEGQEALQVVARAPEAGVYYVMVRATGGDTTDYTLQVELGAAGEGPGRPDF